MSRPIPHVDEVPDFLVNSNWNRFLYIPKWYHTQVVFQPSAAREFAMDIVDRDVDEIAASYSKDELMGLLRLIHVFAHPKWDKRVLAKCLKRECGWVLLPE